MYVGKGCVGEGGRGGRREAIKAPGRSRSTKVTPDDKSQACKCLLYPAYLLSISDCVRNFKMSARLAMAGKL